MAAKRLRPPKIIDVDTTDDYLDSDVIVYKDGTRLVDRVNDPEWQKAHGITPKATKPKR